MRIWSAKLTAWSRARNATGLAIARIARQSIRIGSRRSTRYRAPPDDPALETRTLFDRRFDVAAVLPESLDAAEQAPGTFKHQLRGRQRWLQGRRLPAERTQQSGWPFVHSTESSAAQPRAVVHRSGFFECRRRSNEGG